jgi:hypothetical protein
MGRQRLPGEFLWSGTLGGSAAAGSRRNGLTGLPADAPRWFLPRAESRIAAHNRDTKLWARQYPTGVISVPSLPVGGVRPGHELFARTLSHLRDRLDGLLLIALSVDLGDRRAMVAEDNPGRFDAEFFAQLGGGVVAELVGVRLLPSVSRRGWSWGGRVAWSTAVVGLTPPPITRLS